MEAILSLIWFGIGVIWAIAGKPFIEVCICFLICSVFSGAAELYEIKKELEDWEE